MNGKQSKRQRKVANGIAVQWLKTLVSAEEAAEITVSNFQKYMPKDTHTNYNGQLKLLPYSYKWFCKRVKQMGRETTLGRIESARRNSY